MDERCAFSLAEFEPPREDPTLETEELPPDEAADRFEAAVLCRLEVSSNETSGDRSQRSLETPSNGRARRSFASVPT